MKDLIIIGGEGPDALALDEKSYDRIIAADSGYDRAKKLSLRADLTVGDMDSTSYKEIENSFVYPADKDYTDFELALMKRKNKSYDLIGGGGGRLDHSIAILQDFYKYGFPVRWFTSREVIYFSSSFEIRSDLVFPLSIVPLYECSLETEGLFWDIKKDKVDPLYISLSNRVEKKKCRIKSDKSLMLLIPLEFFSPEGRIEVCLSTED